MANNKVSAASVWNGYYQQRRVCRYTKSERRNHNVIYNALPSGKLTFRASSRITHSGFFFPIAVLRERFFQRLFPWMHTLHRILISNETAKISPSILMGYRTDRGSFVTGRLRPDTLCQRADCNQPASVYGRMLRTHRREPGAASRLSRYRAARYGAARRE